MPRDSNTAGPSRWLVPVIAAGIVVVVIVAFDVLYPRFGGDRIEDIFPDPRDRQPGAFGSASDSGFSSVPDSAWVTFTRAAIVAFHPVVSNDSLAKDEGLASALADLSFHTGTAIDSLIAMGYRVDYRGGDTVWLRAGNRRLRFVRPADSVDVGYVFADSAGRWAAAYGIRAHNDLIVAAREFRKSGTIPARR